VALIPRPDHKDPNGSNVYRNSDTRHTSAYFHKTRVLGFLKRRVWGFRCSGILCCVMGQWNPDVSKQCTASVFKDQHVLVLFQDLLTLESRTYWRLKIKNCVLSKRRNPITPWRSASSQNKEVKIFTVFGRTKAQMASHRPLIANIWGSVLGQSMCDLLTF